MRHFFFLLLGVGYWAVISHADAEESFNLAMATDWKPYLYVDANGRPAGDDLQLLNLTLQRLGYHLNAENLPEQRMALEIEQGQVDVILGAAYTKARERLNFYSVPYRKESIVFGFRFSRHPDFSDISVSTVLAQNYLVAVNKSGWFGKEFERGALTIHGSNLIHAEGTLRRMQLLNMNRVDAVVGDRKVLEAAAAELGIDDFVIARQIIHETDVHFLFSRDRVDEAFMQRFNTALIAAQSQLRYPGP